MENKNDEKKVTALPDDALSGVAGGDDPDTGTPGQPISMAFNDYVAEMCAFFTPLYPGIIRICRGCKYGGGLVQYGNHFYRWCMKNNALC